MSPVLKTLTLIIFIIPVASCNRNTSAGNDRSADVSPPPRIAQVAEAGVVLREADRHAIEPSTMVTAEFEQAVGMNPDCRFQLTAAGRPVLVAKDRTGAIKVNGKIVKLQSPGANPAEGMKVSMSAGDFEVTVTPLVDDGDRLDNGLTQREANLVFTLKNGGRTVGYRGYYLCTE